MIKFGKLKTRQGWYPALATVALVAMVGWVLWPHMSAASAPRFAPSSVIVVSGAPLEHDDPRTAGAVHAPSRVVLNSFADGCSYYGEQHWSKRTAADLVRSAISLATGRESGAWRVQITEKVCEDFDRHASRWLTDYRLDLQQPLVAGQTLSVWFADPNHQG
jgi:hypothetical protein